MTVKKSYTSSIIACVIGSFVQYYNYSVLSALAPVLVRLFSPPDSQLIEVITVLFVYSPIFAFPIGSIAISNFADTFGRKPGILLTVALMAAAIFGISLGFTFAAVGFIAPALLILLRLLHSLSSGAEYTTSTVFITETAPPDKRYYYTSYVYVGQFIGMLVGQLNVMLTMHLLGPESFVSYGWRLLLLFGALLGFIAVMLRKRLHETPAYEKIKKSPLWHHQKFKDVIKLCKKQMAISFAITLLDGAIFCLYLAHYVNFFPSPFKNAQPVSFLVTTISMILSIGLVPYFGKLSQKFGAIKIMLIASIVLLISVFPLSLLLYGDNPKASIVANLLLALLSMLYLAPMGALSALLFPPHWRMSCFSLSHVPAFVISGSFIPFFIRNSSDNPETTVPVLVMACALIAAISLSILYKDKKELVFKE